MFYSSKKPQDEDSGVKKFFKSMLFCGNDRGCFGGESKEERKGERSGSPLDNSRSKIKLTGFDPNEKLSLNAIRQGSRRPSYSSSSSSGQDYQSSGDEKEKQAKTLSRVALVQTQRSKGANPVLNTLQTNLK